MSFLRDLLQAKEPLFDESIRQLEAASHHQGVDAQLVGEIHQKTTAALRILGLDEHDTTGRELYHTLLAQMRRHDLHVLARLGGTRAMPCDELMALLRQVALKTVASKDVWVLKKSVAKDLLRKMPPTAIMKRLGYRSVDSMLKRENVNEIYGALRFAESADWLTAFNRCYVALAPSDFEVRPIEITILSQDRWREPALPFVAKKMHNVTHVKELGVILILPVQSLEILPGMTIWILSVLCHYLNEIRLYSAYFKLQQVKKDFGAIVANTLIADPNLGPVLAGQYIHWRVVQRYFGKLPDEKHPEIFEPHVQPEDLHWRKVEETMRQMDPELSFWHGMDYVAQLQDKQPVTFNMMDIAVSCFLDKPYGQRVYYHFRESLWNEIFVRYMGQKTLEDQVLGQLNNEMIAPERLRPL